MNRITDISKIALGNAKTDVVSRLIVTTNAWAQSHSWAVVLREDYNLLCAFCHFSDFHILYFQVKLRPSESDSSFFLKCRIGLKLWT